jgi:uncharacterized protein YjiS (DUF1127 family)
MIALHRHTFPTAAARSRPIGGPLLAGLERVEAWVERHRQRRALLSLDDHVLKDVGFTRADAEGEAAKWFWQA